MNPEKEIVNLWLNRKGFFTVAGITAANNREVDILAVKQSHGKVEEIMHVEIVNSITSIDTVPLKDILERFNDKTVVKAINEQISKFVSTETGYNKVLVLGKTSKLQQFKDLKDIKVYRLSDVLFEVMNDIDTHNYRSSSLRTLQIVKYILLADPALLANMLDKKEGNILNLNTREQFLKQLMDQDETKRVLAKDSFEPELIKVIKNSSLNKPEKLAAALEEKILGPKSRKKFLETLMQYQGIKQEIKETISKDQKTLKFFAE